MTLYVLKYDGDTCSTHPYTVIAIEQSGDNNQNEWRIVNTVQMHSLETANDLIMRLQSGETTIDALTID